MSPAWRNSASFFTTLGLRPIMERNNMAIFELRGGTHLLLFKAKSKPPPGPIRSFEFMVDDVAGMRERLVAEGLSPGEMKHDDLGGHNYFEVMDPDGHVFGVYSSHSGSRTV